MREQYQQIIGNRRFLQVLGESRKMFGTYYMFVKGTPLVNLEMIWTGESSIYPDAMFRYWLCLNIYIYIHIIHLYGIIVCPDTMENPAHFLIIFTWELVTFVSVKPAANFPHFAVSFIGDISSVCPTQAKTCKNAGSNVSMFPYIQPHFFQKSSSFLLRLVNLWWCNFVYNTPQKDANCFGFGFPSFRCC